MRIPVPTPIPNSNSVRNEGIGTRSTPDVRYAQCCREKLHAAEHCHQYRCLRCARSREPCAPRYVTEIDFGPSVATFNMTGPATRICTRVQRFMRPATGGYRAPARITNRQRIHTRENDMKTRYPAFALIAGLPQGGALWRQAYIRRVHQNNLTMKPESVQYEPHLSPERRVSELTEPYALHATASTPALYRRYSEYTQPAPSTYRHTHKHVKNNRYLRGPEWSLESVRTVCYQPWTLHHTLRPSVQSRVPRLASLRMCI